MMQGNIQYVTNDEPVMPFDRVLNSTQGSGKGSTGTQSLLNPFREADEKVLDKELRRLYNKEETFKNEYDFEDF